jgi:sugar lactone lactonase YvrE
MNALLASICIAAFAIVALPVTVRGQTVRGGDELLTALTSDTVCNGVSTTRDGRIFLVLARMDGSDGPRVAEWVDGKPKPYPDRAWNGWSKGKSAEKALVRVNALRIGPDGDLWLVDVGAPGLGNPKLPGGPKLVRIDPATNAVRRVYGLDAVTSDKSFIDDVRFNGHVAYVTDAGAPGLIVLDLDSGASRRVLDGDISVTAQKPISAEGKVVHGPDGKPVYIHADQLEVSPDGRWLYYQPCSGPLYRIETRWLGDPSLASAELAKHVEKFADTPSTGGTAIDAAGNLYVSDTDRQRILKIAPDGSTSTLVEDPRLFWVDAMWVDRDGFLWMPAAQLNRMAPFQGGVSKVEFPMKVYKLRINHGPPENDHP